MDGLNCGGPPETKPFSMVLRCITVFVLKHDFAGIGRWLRACFVGVGTWIGIPKHHGKWAAVAHVWDPSAATLNGMHVWGPASQADRAMNHKESVSQGEPRANTGWCPLWNTRTRSQKCMCKHKEILFKVPPFFLYQDHIWIKYPLNAGSEDETNAILNASFSVLGVSN